MKGYTWLALPVLISVAGCDSGSKEERAVIRDAVASFDLSVMPRSPQEHHSHAIVTSRGQLVISTTAATKGPGGEYYFEGPSRLTGFFLMPREQWVADADEATRLLIEDYESGNCMPIGLSPHSGPP